MKNSTITLYKKDIYYGVDLVTHIFSNTLDDDNPRTADAISSDTEVGQHKRIITIYADDAVAALKDGIREFLKPEKPVDLDNRITDGDYRIALQVDYLFNDAVLPAVAKAMGSFVVNSCLAKWYESVGNQQTAVYTAEAAADLSRIQRLMYTKNKPIY